MIYLTDFENTEKKDETEIFNNQLNKWYSWKCSIGITRLHISADGEIWRGTCYIGGYLGNVFNAWPFTPEFTEEYSKKSWITCKKNSCLCAPDMRAAKCSDETQIDETIQMWKTQTTLNDKKVTSPSIVFGDDNKRTITWDLGRRCNYSCSYCLEDVHNNHEAHKSLQTLINAYNNLNRAWIENDPVKFIFTGGEPTFNPNYLDFVEFLYSKNNEIHTTTNGSSKKELYEKLAKYSDITFSAHLAQMNKFNNFEKFIENVKGAKNSNEKSNIEVRIMLEPNLLSYAKELYNQLVDLDIKISKSSLTNYYGDPYQYNIEEINWLNS